MNPEERLTYLDAMRGILMILGVVLHSAQVYNPAATWVIHSPLETVVATFVVDGIHLFRLPAFFMVSGYFYLRSLRKYGEHVLLKVRGERILIPLLVTSATLNSVQAYLLDKFGWRNFDLHDYLRNGEWQAHLWFLYFLFIYYILGLIAVRFSRYISTRVTEFLALLVDKCHIIIILALLSFFQLFLQLVSKALPVLYLPVFGLCTVYDLAFYLQFFIFGVLLCRSGSLMAKFSSLSLRYSIPTLFITYLVKVQIAGNKGILTLVAQRYLSIFAVWVSCSICFYLFKRFANTPSKAMSFFASASYSIYLFHHIIVVAIGLVFIDVGFGGVFGFVSLALLVLSFSSFIHIYVVSRYAWLTFFFNGVRTKNNRPMAQAACSDIAD